MASTKVKVNRTDAITRLEKNRDNKLAEIKKNHEENLAEFKKAEAKFKSEFRNWLAAVKKALTDHAKSFTLENSQVIDDAYDPRSRRYKQAVVTNVPERPHKPSKPVEPMYDYEARRYNHAIGLLELSNEDIVSVSMDDVGHLL